MKARILFFVGLMLISQIGILFAQLPKTYEMRPLQRSNEGGRLGLSINTMTEDSWTFAGKVVLLKTALQQANQEPTIEYVKLSDVEDFSSKENQELISFPLAYMEVENLPAGIVISWEVATKADVSGYELQRSEDGKSWESVGSVKAAQPEQGVAFYQLTDVNVEEGVYRYRLIQQGVKEHDKRQEVWVARWTEGCQITYLYPNPYMMGVSLHFELAEKQPLEVIFRKKDGAVVGQMATKQASEGHHTIELDLAALSKAAYTCDIQLGTHKHTIPLTE